MLSDGQEAGVPARVIGTLDDYLEKREAEDSYPSEIRPMKQEIPHDLIDWAWEKFRKNERVILHECIGFCAA